MAAADPVGALVALLLADATMIASLGTRVFGGELPQAEARHMPRRALVVRPSGGPSLTGGSNVEHDTLRLDLFAFGATPAEAGQVMHAAALRLKRVQREVWASTLLHWVQSAGGFASGREPDTDWPRVFQSFQTLYAMETVS